MKKTLLITFFLSLVILSCTRPTSGTITGLWKCTDEHSNKPKGLVVIYKYKDEYYGRMLATYDDNGNIKDSIVEKKEHAPGVVGDPPYCGMDFIYGLREEKHKKGRNPVYTGKIIDPEKGKVYKVEVWRKKNMLVVRGEVFIFGKDIFWPEANNSDLPPHFSINNVKDFVPEIPVTK